MCFLYILLQKSIVSLFASLFDILISVYLLCVYTGIYVNPFFNF